MDRPVKRCSNVNCGKSDMVYTEEGDVRYCRKCGRQENSADSVVLVDYVATGEDMTRLKEETKEDYRKFLRDTYEAQDHTMSYRQDLNCPVCGHKKGHVNEDPNKLKGTVAIYYRCGGRGCRTWWET